MTNSPVSRYEPVNVEERRNTVPGRVRVDPDEGLVWWSGDITWRVTAGLREDLFDALEVPGHAAVRLDVRDVTSIDRTGIAVLIAANHRASAVGRRLTLIDRNGRVTAALAAGHFLPAFNTTQKVPQKPQPRGH